MSFSNRKIVPVYEDYMITFGDAMKIKGIQ